MRIRHTLQLVLFISTVIAVVLTAWLSQTNGWELRDDARYLCYFAVAWLANRLRVRSRVTGDSCSMGFVFVLIALVELNTVETILISSCAILVDCTLRRVDDEMMWETASGLVSNGFAAVVAQWFYHWPVLSSWGMEWPVRFVSASLLCFVAGSAPLLLASAYKGKIPLPRLMQSMYVFSFPYYVVAATITAIYAAVQPFVEWYATALLVPMMVLLHRSLQRFSDRIDQYRDKADRLASLQQRTMEVLALAMEKDQITPQHLRRMQFYAVEIGKALGLSQPDLDALKAAAVVHDVGKLAVPDHITSKSARFTAEEFEKMKIHTAIGAGIIERANFPYPVAPIVRSHHERWDGSGYPDQLKGEDIPIGARILGVVDSLDALITPRSYRPAISLEAAIEVIVKGAGTDYDPKISSILHRRYRQFEQKLARVHPKKFETAPAHYLQTIGAARHEMSALFQLHEQLSRSLTVSDVGHVLRNSFRDLLPYDALAVYFQDTPDAKPDIVCGDRTLIRRRRPMLTLALPFSASPAGRVALYCLLADRCTPEHVRLFRGLLPRIGQAIENGRKFAATANCATMDYLTRLPNMASLTQRLKDEVDAAAKTKSDVIVLICDLDGFKSVNDTLGHLTGNRVLVEVAQALSQNTRGDDYVARMGGDEFLMILPGNAGARLDERIGALRKLVREAGRKACDADIIDASFGAAHYPKDGNDVEELVAVADQRMYDDKTARKKNRAIAIAAPDPEDLLAAGPVM